LNYHTEKKDSNLGLQIAFRIELKCLHIGDCKAADAGEKEIFTYGLRLYPNREELILPFRCRVCGKPAQSTLKVESFGWNIWSSP